MNSNMSTYFLSKKKIIEVVCFAIIQPWKKISRNKIVKVLNKYGIHAHD